MQKYQGDIKAPIEKKEEPKDGDKKIKILAYCDSPTVNTGFGIVAQNVLKRLHATGKYEIVVWGVNYYGMPHDLPYKIYPATLDQHGDLYGRQQFINFMASYDFDILWSLNDTFIISTFIPEAVVQLRRERPDKLFQWIYYFPIDTEYFRKSWLVPVMTSDYPVCYNDWSYQQLVNAAPELKRKMRTIYHGVDEKTFFPMPEEEIKAFRKDYWKDMIQDDTFLIINVNRNQQRKDMYRTLKAFSLLKKRLPNSHLYLHCNVEDMGGNILHIAAQLGLQGGKDFSYPHPERFHPSTGLPIETLNKIYNAADVVMSTTLGEGCGLSSYEAMATRTPIVMPNNTALIETMVEGRGFPVKSGEGENAHVVMPQDNSVVRPLTDVDDMAKQLYKVATEPKTRKEVAQKGYDYIMGKTWDKVGKDWVNIFAEVEERVANLKAGSSMPVGDISGGIAGAGN